MKTRDFGNSEAKTMLTKPRPLHSSTNIKFSPPSPPPSASSSAPRTALSAA
eukprot:CAMPEP_0179718546 /NCGR_PEP_ID=MMETSP0938-20121108/2963_1 /TAXON_ID=548131 ORGANISM="Ostreococcus mediterraneus, Strain clade-D-RCC1107" /NCGR_SAMPLE_ID=MMETSP0938 /ASSEMBLY_ACC=CAM_ASM_000576 /LENGTH=50 /DNA_ID=CAMNT_0021592349 /DNA_START=573 /DNA_END=725 /DNA_ORIENTATION=-